MSQQHSSSSLLVLSLLVLSILLVSSPPGTLAAGDDGHPPSKPIVTRITKDSATSLYTIPVKNGAPLVLDLGGSLVWSTCQPSHRTIPCKSSVCKVANRNLPAGCGGQQPGSAVDPKYCACTAYPSNPVSGHCGSGDVTVVPISANATDGKNLLFPVSFSALGVCAPDGLLDSSLPEGAAGVTGLSRQPLSLPSQVASKLKVAKEFLLCLPGDRGTGVAIFGGGPLKLHAGWSDKPVDFAEGLRQGSVPLLKNSKNSGAYYIRAQGIAVNRQQVPVPSGAFDLDASHGSGGVMLSTVTPYTLVRPDIFGPLLDAFEKVTSGFPVVKPPPPFFRCYESSAIGMTRQGFAVPNIELMLEGGRNWTFPGGSSLVGLNNQLACFAFLNMGSSGEPAVDNKSPAMILGAFHMQDNLLLFDLEKEKFGFSELLWGTQTNCGNFDTASSS